MKRANDAVEAAKYILDLYESTIEYQGGFIVKDKEFEPYGFMRLRFMDNRFKEYNATTIINKGSKENTFYDVMAAIQRDAKIFIV